MAAIAALLIGGGAAASIGGSYLGGQSQQKAGNKAFGQSLDMYERQQQNLLNLLYGNAAPNANNMGGAWGPDGRFHTGFQEGTQYIPHAGAAGTYGGTGTSVRPGGNGLLARMAMLGDQYGQGADQIMGQYDQATGSLLQQMTGNTNRLDQMGAGAEGMASQWGQGREKIIRDDAARSLKDQNRMGDAALAAGGFNSPTIRANQYAGNAEGNQRAMQRSLQDLSEGQIDRTLRARENRTGTLASRLGMSDQFSAGRAGEKTGLMAQFLNQKTALNAAPLQTELQAGMSSIMNPWTGNNMSSYNPGGSALGSALQTGGNIGLGLGGYWMGQQGQGQGQGQQKIQVQQPSPWQNPTFMNW